MKSFLSIITPIYNRADLVSRTYESLKHQTDKDFEWIIVDDGSTDNSYDVCNSFKTDKFKITCVRKKNGGKHTALNCAFKYINSDYVVFLDSDDYLSNDAVEIIKHHWKKYENNDEIGFLVFLRKNAKTNQIFCTVENFNHPVNFFKETRKKAISGDCCEVIRSSILSDFRFPEYANERFIGESALWDTVSLKKKCVYINSAIYCSEYLEDGLTKSGKKLRLSNPRGGMFIANLEMSSLNRIRKRIKYAVLYNCYSKVLRMGLYKSLKNTDHPILVFLFSPVGAVLHSYWSKKYCA